MTSAPQSRAKIRSISYAKYGYYFILPFFITYCFFQLWPLINTFILSTKGNGLKADDFVGLQNFEYLLFGSADRAGKAIKNSFQLSLSNTLLIWFGNFIPQLGISLTLAVWFTDLKLKIKGKGFFKVVMYMPNIITAASVSALFLSLFGDYKTSPINSMLLSLGLIDDPIKFVTGVANARGMVMFMQTWMWFGNTMIMLMSGIMGISPSLFEAANIDGANGMQVFRHVTVPLLRPILLYTLVTSMIGGLQMFDIPFLFHYGDPVSEQVKTVAVFIFQHFRKAPANYGYSSAASVLLFFVTATLGSVTFFMNRDKDEMAKKKYLKAQRKLIKANNSGFGGR